MIKFIFTTLNCFIILNNLQIKSAFPSYSNNEEVQNEFIDPCSLIKCSEEEICIAKNEVYAYCLNRNDIQLNQMTRRQVPTFCGTNECRFGECEVFNATSFVCHCTKGITGENCNKLDTSGNPCSSNPCYGDSVCINLADSFICVCGPGRTGPDCTSHASPCQCQNGAVCLSNPDGTFGCKCPQGFGGFLCQYPVTPFLSCQITGCLNDGICTVFSKCNCPPGFTGLRCESAITTTKSTTTTTVIPPHYNINVCYVGICQNGGSCYQLGTNFGICICKDGFSGPYCTEENNNITKKTTLTTTPLVPIVRSNFQPCPTSIPNPCQNNGICVYSESTNTIICNCQPTYQGPFCGTRVAFCEENPCKNGGICNQTDKFEGTCSCPPSFTGFKCDISLTCDPNPCLNNQPCLVVGGAAKCFCSSRFKPPFCEKYVEE